MIIDSCHEAISRRTHCLGDGQLPNSPYRCTSGSAQCYEYDLFLHSCTCFDGLQKALTDIMLLYLLPYSPDLNPIEESFSTWKAYLRRCGATLEDAEDPIFSLLESVGCVNATTAAHWFYHAGYIVDQEE